MMRSTQSLNTMVWTPTYDVLFPNTRSSEVCEQAHIAMVSCGSCWRDDWPMIWSLGLRFQPVLNEQSKMTKQVTVGG